jgi:tetratricopeptide (TPR) repeat protein
VNPGARAEDLPRDDNDPAVAVHRFDAVLLDDDEAGLAERIRGLFVSGTTLPAARLEYLLRARQGWRRFGLPPAATRDALVGLTSVDKDGNERVGYRLHYTRPFGNAQSTWFVVREDGRYLVFASPDDLAPLGRRALRFLDEGDTAAAVRLLDWAAAEAKPPADDHDPLAPAPFARVWQGNAGGPTEVVRLAATMLLLNGSPADTDEALRHLLSARATLPTSVPTAAVDVAIIRAQLKLKQWPAALALATRMATEQPLSLTLFNLRWTALTHLKRHDELRALAQARLAAVPDDAPATRALATADERQQRWPSFEHDLRQLIAKGHAEAHDYNRLAWAALFHGSVGEPALADARRAVELSQHRVRAYLHTLAALQAELGQAAAARATLLEGIDANTGEPQPSDHYVMGRIAEQLGLRDAALAEYRQVDASEPDDAELSAFRLAERRLKVLAAH